MQKRLLASLFAIALGIAMCSSQARADEVTVAGSASGYFNNNQTNLNVLAIRDRTSMLRLLADLWD